MFYLSERRDITEQPPVVVLLASQSATGVACLPTLASSFSDALFFDRKAQWHYVGLVFGDSRDHDDVCAAMRQER